MIMSFKSTLINSLINIYLNRKYKFEVNYKEFDPNTDTPYILLASNPSLLDGLFVSKCLKNKPVMILNELEKTNKINNYFLSKYEFFEFKKSTGFDVSIVKRIHKTLLEKPVLIFPEKQTSFFGNGSQISESIAKLIKKEKKDVVICKINGAYLSNPRWGIKNSKRGFIELSFETIYKSSEIDNLEGSDILTTLKNKLYFNDFEWNREFKNFYYPKNRALGLERYLYVCPKCFKSQTLSTSKNNISCSECGHIASFDDFSLITGLDFDDLISWDNLQKNELSKLANKVVYSSGSMYSVDLKTMELTLLGYADLEIMKSQLFVLNKMKEYMFEIEKIKELQFLRRNELFFTYGKKTYLFSLDDPMIIYDSINYIKANL